MHNAMSADAQTGSSPANRLQHGHSAAGGAHCYEGTTCATPERMVLSTDHASRDALLAVINCVQARRFKIVKVAATSNKHNNHHDSIITTILVITIIHEHGKIKVKNIMMMVMKVMLSLSSNSRTACHEHCCIDLQCSMRDNHCEADA